MTKTSSIDDILTEERDRYKNAIRCVTGKVMAQYYENDPINAEKLEAAMLDEAYDSAAIQRAIQRLGIWDGGAPGIRSIQRHRMALRGLGGDACGCTKGPQQ